MRDNGNVSQGRFRSKNAFSHMLGRKPTRCLSEFICKRKRRTVMQRFRYAQTTRRLPFFRFKMQSHLGSDA